MKAQILEATTLHAEAITQLLIQMGYPDQVEVVAQRIEENQRSGYKIFVAEIEKQIVGFISVHTYTYLHAAGLMGRIMTFCVDEATRNTGIGTQLLTHAENYLVNQGCIKIELNCNNRRTETHQFYKQRGYTQTSLHFVKKLI
ncbi:MAG: GNAT family N-acetyltransferase [Cyclobacteriaceae bacterium]|nr:GNAT family N-acetyltransferase [Cyclobacteriaceae bacterium]